MLFFYNKSKDINYTLYNYILYLNTDDFLIIAVAVVFNNEQMIHSFLIIIQRPTSQRSKLYSK